MPEPVSPAGPSRSSRGQWHEQGLRLEHDPANVRPATTCGPRVEAGEDVRVERSAEAPNVLVVLIDDMGFGIPSAFGGPVHMPMMFSADETADVGVDEAMPVTEDYKKGDNAFTGKIQKVTIEVGAIGAGTKAEAAQAGAESAAKQAAVTN